MDAILVQIQTELTHIREHISTLNDEMGETRDLTIELRTDVAWLKRSYWIVVGTSLGAALAALSSFLSKFF